jgi:hypothetical protein
MQAGTPFGSTTATGIFASGAAFGATPGFGAAVSRGGSDHATCNLSYGKKTKLCRLHLDRGFLLVPSEYAEYSQYAASYWSLVRSILSTHRGVALVCKSL